MLNKKQFALTACADLEAQKMGDGSYRWKDSQAILKTLGVFVDDHNAARSILKRLAQRGVLEMRGVGKYKWRIKNPAWDRDNPFNTPIIKDDSKPLIGVTGTKQGSKMFLGGNTYDHRNVLRKHGCRWDEVTKCWWYDADLTVTTEKLQSLGVEFEDDDGKELPGGIKVDSEEVAELRQLVERLEKKIETLDEARKVEITLIKEDGKKVDFEERVHPIFEQVLFHIQCGDHVMLVGPKGCGKTHLCEQVAKVLDRSHGMISLSGGVTEAKLFGRCTPNITTGKSEYSSTLFVELFEEGGVFLLDEVDAADPNVLLSINSALANKTLAIDRTKHPIVKAHKDFVCMAAANTWGNGADRQYVGRNQQDSAFTERFVQIAMDYDRALELSLCPGAEDMVTKLHEYRDKVYSNRLERTISTRFILRAYNWIQHSKDFDYIQTMLFSGWRDDEVRKVKGGY